MPSVTPRRFREHARPCGEHRRQSSSRSGSSKAGAGRPIRNAPAARPTGTRRASARLQHVAAYPNSDQRVARLAADDERLDVVPAIAVGRLRDAKLEFSEELGEQTGGSLALEREGTGEQRPAPCRDAHDVVASKDRMIVVSI